MAKKKESENIALEKSEVKNDVKPSYTKEQILNSKRIKHSKDILSVILNSDNTYSSDEVDKLVKDFKERKVK